MNGNSHNKKQVLILLVLITIGIVGLMISGVASQPAEAQSTYNVNYTFTAHSGEVTSIAILDNGNIITVSWDNTAKIWDPDTGNVQLTFNKHNSRVSDVEQLDNGNIITVSWDNTAKIWDPDTGNVQLTFDKHTDILYDVEQLDNGSIITTSEDETAKIWDPDTGNVQLTFDKHTNWVLAAHQLENGDIATGSLDDTVKIWDPDTGNVQLTFDKHTFRVWDVEQLDNGSILSTSTDNTAKIWDPDTGNVYTTFDKHTGNVIDGEQLTNGNIITGSIDATARIWDPETGIENIKFTNHTFNVNHVEQLDNGNIVTSSKDETAKIWDAGLPSESDSVANPVAVTDVQKSSKDFTFYAIGNADLDSGDTLTWDFGDGTNTTAQANKTVTHNYNSHGRYTVNVTTSDGKTRSTEVVVHSEPSISNLINPNPALEGESISLDGSGSDSQTTAARPAPSQLQVTSGLQSWVPYHSQSQLKDSFYNGFSEYDIDSSPVSARNHPTDRTALYETGDESYLTNPVNLQNEWTISSYVGSGSNDIVPVFNSSSGHGVYIDNGDLTRVYPSGSEVVATVDPTNDLNLTVTHDGTGSFDYYDDDTLIGQDSYGGVINDATYITQAPDQIDGKSQDTLVYLDDWRIYDRVLSQNEIDLVTDRYNVSTLSESKLYYQYELDSTVISTNSTHTISGLQAGNYTVKLTVQDNDGLTTTSSKTLEIKDVVAPRIDDVSPDGDLIKRDIDIQANISHPNIGTNYEVEVVLTRVNQQTGQTKTLVTKNISSNQVVTYNADHTNTGVENYNIDREYFEYEWTAQEPQQGLTESSGIKRYSIPVSEIIINNVNTEGFQTTRDVDLSADIDGTVTNSLDVKLELYDLREDTTTTEYQTTIKSAQTVSTTISHSLNRTSVPSDYRTQNRYSYQWVVTTDSGTSKRSQTKDYRIPGLIYPVNENGNLVGGVDDILNVADLNAEQDDYIVNRSGKFNSSVFLPDFSRSYTALMYDKNDSKVFEKTFTADNQAFDFSGLQVKDSYLVLTTDISGNTYGVSARRFVNGNVTLDVRDGTRYFVSVTDGETRRSVGPYIADKDNQKQSQTVSPDSLNFEETEQVKSQITTTYDEENQTGTITIEWSAGDKEVENLRVEVIRDDDNKIIFRDSVGGKVENYKNTVAVSDVNSTYSVNFEYYLVNQSKTVTSSEKVTIKFQQVLDGLPDWMTTALGVVILLMMTFILGEISAAYGLFAVVAAGGVMTLIGWLPISITVVMQAGLVAVLYFIKSDSTIT